MNRHANRFLFVWWEGGGNMPPILHVVRQLVARGHRVHVLGDPVSERAFNDAGASFDAFQRAPRRVDANPANDPLRDWEARSPRQALAAVRDRLMFGPAREYALDTLDAIACFRPHAMAVMDMTFGAMVAAERAGVPCASVAPHIYCYPAPGLPPFGPGFQPARNAFHRLRDFAVSRITAREFGKALPAFNEVRRMFGLEHVRGIFEQVDRMERHLVMASQAFDFPSPKLPANVRYVGPVLADPDWAERWESPWPEWRGEPLVLVSFSSTFQNQGGAVQRAIDALGSIPVRAVVTLGPALDPARFTARPNVNVCRSAPHSQVLRRADAMITHAGHGSVMCALAHGVPLVCAPMGRDQNDVAARVTFHGAGVRVSPSAGVREFREAVREVLDNQRYRRAAEWMSRFIRRDAHRCTVIQELEALAGAAPRAAEGTRVEAFAD